DIEFLAGIFAFGAMLAFAIAHLSIIVLRYREPELPRPFRIPLSVKVGSGSLPLPALVGGAFAAAAWVSVILFHAGARVIGGPRRCATRRRSSTARSSYRSSARSSTTTSSGPPAGWPPRRPRRARAAR